MEKDIIKELIGFDIHILTENDENKIFSFLDFVDMKNVEFSIDRRENEYPFYKLDLHIECNGYGIKYCNDSIKKELPV